MKIFIDDKTATEIKNILSKKSKSYGIRIYIPSYELDNPNLSLSLYEIKENDTVVTFNDINFYLDNGVTDFESDIEITSEERFGNGFNVKYKII